MDNVLKQYAILAPFIPFAYASAKGWWLISLLSAAFLLWVCFYSDFYRFFRKDKKLSRTYLPIFLVFGFLLLGAKLFGFYEEAFFIWLTLLSVSFMGYFFHLIIKSEARIKD